MQLQATRTKQTRPIVVDHTIGMPQMYRHHFQISIGEDIAEVGCGFAV